MTTASKLFNISEAAAFLNVSVSTMRRLQQQRYITFFKVGGSIRFSKEDLDAYLQKARIRAMTESDWLRGAR